VQTSEGSDAPGAINVGVIVGAVLAGIVLIVIAMALVGCIVFLLYPKVTKEKQYVMFARFRRDTSNVELVRTRRRDVTSMITLNSVQLAEYDDPEAYVAGLPYEQPLLTTAPPLPPSNDKKVDVYEPMTMQTGDNLIVTNPHAISGGYETVVRQEDPVSGVVLTSNGQTALYDTMTDGGQPMQVVYETIESQYDYVPDEVSRRQGTLPRRPTGLEEELKRIYEGVTRSEYEDIPFVPPGEKLNTLYDQLANKKCIEIPRVYLKQESVLGTGEFGDVFKGVWETPYGPQDVAMKMLKSGSNEKDKINFLKEAALMGQFRHPHVIRLLGTVTVVDPCMIVLEFLAGKDLESYLHDHRPEPGVLPESSLPFQLLKFCCEIADGMKYLSNKGFIHRDLATRNVLLDKNLQCKIADFGLSKTLQSDSEYYIAKGGRVPVRWTAPEALHYKKYTISSDVWSFGMTMYEIWSLGEKPFSQMDALNVVKKLQREVSYVQPPPPGCPRDMYRLMVYCWDRNHHSRPTFGAIFGVLSGPPDSLLLLPSDDLQQTKDPSKAGQLGMPLEFGEDLYQDLQHYYNSDEA
jgi:tRNA A-37 threonylcarbamoyl transferase component Bud32